MSRAIYAIPGLMPPSCPYYDTRVTLPESGKVKLCVYCGKEDDTVHYCLQPHGFRGGFIKDPSYPFPDTPWGKEMAKGKERWPQYMHIDSELPGDAQVLKVIKHDKWAVPVTERKDVDEKVYWILEVPADILPPGDTILELSVNGNVRQYTLQRPEFGAYKLPNISERYTPTQE